YGLFCEFSSINKTNGEDQSKWLTRWNSFAAAKGGGITVATAFRHARDAGWKPCRQRRDLSVEPQQGVQGACVSPGDADTQELSDEIPEYSGEQLRPEVFANAPGLIKEYLDFYMNEAWVPDHTYALTSALLFMTGVVGNLVHVDD